jgi:4-methyl-5(b-hydroxyethyl)-thiazole monophosphate biosynthesis
MIYQFLATGFEDIEALAPLDIIRRAGLDITTVSITDDKVVYSAHGVGVVADATLSEVDLTGADMLVLPGGLPGSTNLDECEPLRQAILKHHAEGKPLAAICAAPMVYGHLGILKGVKATCYPGVQGELKGAEYTADIVTKDGQFITGRGPAAAMEFGYAIAEHFLGKEAVAPLREGMIYNQLLGL